MNNRLHKRDFVMRDEGRERPAQHGLATDPPELLGQGLGEIAARARSPACGHDDDGDLRHVLDAPQWTLGLAHEHRDGERFSDRTRATAFAQEFAQEFAYVMDPS